MKDKIFLIGFMGSGKSTIGEILAKLSGYEFVDMDKLIEEEDGAPIREIFIKRGEHHFRNLESKLLDSLIEKNHFIAACGGGIIHDSLNVEVLMASGSAIFLEGNINTLYARVKEDENRPFAFLDILDEVERFEKFASLYDKRKDAYVEASFAVVNIDGKNPEEIANYIYTNYIKKAVVL
ncbi:MAG: shikimate kinase [Eubacteriales bacterium]